MVLRAVTILLFALSAASSADAAGDAVRGHAGFQHLCTACHSTAANQNMTGPSLAHIYGRKAGTLSTFDRYSPEMKSAELRWDEKTLDQWLKNPAALIPNNRMTFPGIAQANVRQDIIAYLKAVSSGSAPQTAGNQGGMDGMMGSGQLPDLKKDNPTAQVQSITHCRDTYRVTTADGQTHDFWERNLRFKTDMGELGPVAGKPILIHAGMMGDRADVIFSSSAEISRFVTPKC
jgi:cytochrome c